jgi:hypothetical protein
MPGLSRADGEPVFAGNECQRGRIAPAQRVEQRLSESRAPCVEKARGKRMPPRSLWRSRSRCRRATVGTHRTSVTACWTNADDCGRLLLFRNCVLGVQPIGRLEGVLHVEAGTRAPFRHGNHLRFTVPNRISRIISTASYDVPRPHGTPFFLCVLHATLAEQGSI